MVYLLAVGALVSLAFFEPARVSSKSIGATLAADQRFYSLQLQPQPNRVQGQQPAFSDTGVVAPCDEDEKHGPVAQLRDDAPLYESPVIAAPFRFNALSFQWDADLPGETRLEVHVRTSDDGQQWSEWMAAEEADALRGTRASITDPVFSTGRFVQYRVMANDAPEDWTPFIQQLRISYIDSTQGPTADEAQWVSDGSVASRLMALVRPNVVGRAAWGANESLRFQNGEMVWPPSYVPAVKIIVHHTVTGNEPQDPAAIIRAIYYDHAINRAWGDIGYNFIIDPQGRVYEGRFGGKNVVGAHAEKYNSGSVGIALLGTFTDTAPAAAASAALERFLIAKAVEQGFDPKGRSFFIDKTVPNIMGHRDVVSTACPGTVMYGRLPGLRDSVQAGLPAYGEAWIGDATPKVMDPGAEVKVNLTVRNSGTAAWNVALPSPYRVGYHWYNSDGTLYTDEPFLEYHTDLPRIVAPGEQVVVQAIVRVPSKLGRYILRWDMVQERIAWFTSQGNQELDRVVSVLPLLSLPNDTLVTMPNDLLVLAPPERLRTLPLSRLTLLTNADILDLVPDLIPFFPNERVLSFSNDILIRYMPDNRLKTFSMERIRTFPEDVQQRLGFAVATPAAGTATPTPTRVPTTPTPIPTVADPGGATAP